MNTTFLLRMGLLCHHPRVVQSPPPPTNKPAIVDLGPNGDIRAIQGEAMATTSSLKLARMLTNSLWNGVGAASSVAGHPLGGMGHIRQSCRAKMAGNEGLGGGRGSRLAAEGISAAVGPDVRHLALYDGGGGPGLMGAMGNRGSESPNATGSQIDCR